jgi:hypothetical protein
MVDWRSSVLIIAVIYELDFINHGGLFEVGLLLFAKPMKQKVLNLLIGCWVFLLLSISMLLLYKATQVLSTGLCDSEQ